MQLAAPLRERSPSGGARVLVVDDDVAVLRVFGLQLTRAGYDVELEPDSRLASVRLASEEFDLVICDVEMPGMTGTELLTQLRAAKNDVPFVLVTGNPQLHTAMKAVELGVVRYLTKPVEGRVFVQVAAEAVRVHGLARAERLARDNEALRSLVEELNRSRVAAEAASHAKTLFLHTMSDELRTPLVGILGLTELVLDDELTDGQREYLVTVQESANLLLSKIQDVIDVANLTQGKMRLVCKPFSVKDAVTSALRKLEPAAAEKGLNLSRTFVSSLPEQVDGEAVKFGQIIGALVDNAIKFTKVGEVNVCAEGRRRPDGSTLVTVTVKDTGVGISPELLPLIFDPFVQGDSALSRAQKGSGLGLAIASQLALLMGGVVEVLESAPGKGSTLRVAIPFAAAHVHG
jgi:signal transduction histidine kinase